MGKRENILGRVKRETPKAYRIIDELERQAIKAGCTGASIITTEDMTPEEEEMALYGGFLKEGYPPEIAEKKAKQWRQRAEQLFK